MITPKEFTWHRSEHKRGSLTLGFETGKMANLADGSVMVGLGDNVFLVATCMDKAPNPDKDRLPLTIDWRESYSAAGKIGGGRFRKREGKPSDDAVLYARLTDRCLRPLFPKGMINDVVVNVSPLAIDGTQDLGVLSIIASSLSVCAAGIPFAGPVGAVRIGYIDGQYVINPTLEQLEITQLNLLVAGPQDNINMIECDAREVPAAILEGAWDLAQEHINQTITRQQEFLAKLSIASLEDKVMYNKAEQEVVNWTSTILTDAKLTGIVHEGKNAFGEVYGELEEAVLTAATSRIEDEADEFFSTGSVKKAVKAVIKAFVRKRTIHEGVRLDGRDVHTIRPLYCEVDLLPQVHGTGLFWRGDTQVLSTVTLGAPSDGQLKDTMETDDHIDHYMHHYNFCSYSTGEARAKRFVSRREIGHGKLAEKALEYMVPDKSAFPYAIRVVSECLSSGGSTSMGATCASTLSLMAAGVPLKAPVSGIAMGLMTDVADDGISITAHQVLTDIMGTEDFIGDMDFKVAGTKTGVTAIQMDTKLRGIPVSIVKETVQRADIGRDNILDFMLQTIDKPRATVSEYAPKVSVINVNPAKIRDIIGKGGETIDKIIEQSGGVKIDIEDDGTVFVADTDQKKIDKAIAIIEGIVMEYEVGQVYSGKVSRIEAYGVFVTFPNGKMGLLHISKAGEPGMSEATLRATFKMGQELSVKVLRIDEKGKISVGKA